MVKRARGRSIEDRVRDQVKKRNDSGGSFRPILDFSEINPKPNSWKIKESGKCRISILPYIVSSENHPDLNPGDMDYKLEVWIHSGVGINNDSVLCMAKTYGKPCYICEQKKKLMDKGLEWDDEEVSALAPSRRVWYNIEVPKEKDKGIQIWHKVSWKNYEKRLMGTAEEDYEDVVIFASLKEGAYVDFKAVDAKFGRVKYFDYENFSLDARPAMGEEKLDEVYPLDALLIIPIYDEIKTLFEGGEIEKPDNEPDESEYTEKSPPAGRESPPKRKPKKIVDEEPDDAPLANKCPYDYTFGKDCNTGDGCSECEEELFTECIDLQESMKEPEEEKPKKRTLKRK